MIDRGLERYRLARCLADARHPDANGAAMPAGAATPTGWPFTVPAAPEGPAAEAALMRRLDAILPVLGRAEGPSDGIVAGNLKLLHGAGLIGLTLPVALGGEGAGLRLACCVTARLAAFCPVTATALARHHGELAGFAADTAWPRELRALVACDVLGRGARLGLPAHGPGPAWPAATAQLRPGHWRVSGALALADGPAPDWLIVLARTEEATPRIGRFLIDLTAPGIDRAGNVLRMADVALPLDHGAGLVPVSTWDPAPDPLALVWRTALTAALAPDAPEDAARIETLAGLIDAIEAGLPPAQARPLARSAAEAALRAGDDALPPSPDRRHHR